MTASDYDGLHCDFCHSLYDPFFETTYNGIREGNDWSDYWDEAGNTGGRKLIRVQDNGLGMDQETVDHAFTLFFSSKGTGTGLGLFISHKIAQAHGGHIEVESQAGSGTTVTLWLPRMAAGSEGGGAAAESDS